MDRQLSLFKNVYVKYYYQSGSKVHYLISENGKGYWTNEGYIRSELPDLLDGDRIIVDQVITKEQFFNQSELGTLYS